MCHRAFLSVAFAITGLAALMVLLSPAPSSSFYPTFTPPPTFTPVPSPTPRSTPIPSRRVAVFTVTASAQNNGSCSSNCQYFETWLHPVSGTVYNLYENSCISVVLFHTAFIRAADNHPGVGRSRDFRIVGAPVVTNPGYITAYLDVGWFAGNAICWFGEGLLGGAASGGYGKLSCWDQTRIFDSPYDANCSRGSFFVYTRTSVRCLPDHIKDFDFRFAWYLSAGCLYATCGGQIESSALLTLYICSGVSPSVLSPAGCRCEGPGTCFWSPRFQHFEVRGTAGPMNGGVQISDWSGVSLSVWDYGRELLSFAPFSQTRWVTLTQPGFWFIDVFSGCPLPWLRGDLGYTSSASFGIVCPLGGYLDARYAPSPATRLVCTIPQGTYAVSVFPPLFSSAEAVYPGPYTGIISLSSPIFVISNSYAISEIWTLTRTRILTPAFPSFTVPIITVPLATDCLTVPPQIFVDIFDVDQIVICLELIGFRFSDDLPWGSILLDALVLGVAAVLVFAAVRALRE